MSDLPRLSCLRDALSPFVIISLSGLRLLLLCRFRYAAANARPLISLYSFAICLSFFRFSPACHHYHAATLPILIDAIF